MLFALGGGKALIAQRDGHGRIRVYAALTAPEAWVAARVDPARPAEARAMLLDHFAGWAPELLAMIRAAGDRVAPRVIRALPVGHRWATRPGLTLIGDAAHPMPPSGEGANLALRDGADLGVALVDSDDRDAAVAGFEALMLDRAGGAAADASGMLDKISDPDGLERMKAFFRAHEQPA